MNILIRNGRVIDPDTKMDKICDLQLKEGYITAFEKNIETKEDVILDAAGCYVMPGLIDMHVHLRDPGEVWKEDVMSGGRAAARGGYTTILAMPNTKPVIDSPNRVDYVKVKAESSSPIHVLQAGAITKGQKGEALADIEGMIVHGIPAISEDGKSVMNAGLYKKAMDLAAQHGIPVLAHCEDVDLMNGGCVNEDKHSRAAGLPGIMNVVEDVIIARDILLAEATGAHLHLCHCSTIGSVNILREAKKRGIDVSGEVCPHHFILTSDDIIPGNTNYKMNPPLRTAKDKEALQQGLKEDIFEVISTDHAPHSVKEKMATMKKAPFGIVGLETAAALTLTELVNTGILTPMQMAEKMSYHPAKILHLKGRGSLVPGSEADVVLIDPEAKYEIDTKCFESKGANTPFAGKKVKGRIMVTICGGKIVYQDKERNLVR